MKKVLLMALSAAALCSCGSKNRFIVEGNLAGVTGTVYLFDEEQQVIDSAAVDNGAFRFKGTVEGPAMYMLSDAKDDSGSFYARFFLEPGTITISDDAENPMFKIATGTPANDANAAWNEAARALILEAQNPETSDERSAAIEEEYYALFDSVYQANRGNYLGAFMLAQQINERPGEELLNEIAAFSPELQASKLLTDLKRDVEQMIKTEVGQPCIDVVQPDADGNEVSLKSVVENPANKYVLLDFWASWCGPCMGEVPHLKKTYDEFHKKGFEIFGVSFDNDREDWLGAIEKNKMNWIHVSEVNGWENQAREDYVIQGIPSNFLIDSEGTIIARNLRGEALYEKIAELLD